MGRLHFTILSRSNRLLLSLLVMAGLLMLRLPIDSVQAATAPKTTLEQLLNPADAERILGLGQTSAEQTVRGILRSAPLLGIGNWSIQTDAGVSLTVVVKLKTLLNGPPPVGSWVRVEGKLQLSGLMLATSIVLDEYEPNQVIVRLTDGLLAPIVANRYGLIVKETPAHLENIVVFSKPGLVGDLLQIVARLQKDVDVIWSELVYVLGAPEGDPYKTWAWGGVEPAGYTNQIAFQQVNLAPALEHSQGDGVVVAILDTGIDLQHPALAGRLAPGWDAVGLDYTPHDEGAGFAWGHGTHAAGIIARIVPQSRLMPVRVLNPNGRGNSLMLALGIEWAVRNGADVVNLSLGMPYRSILVSEAIERAQAAGVTVVAAAGNQGVARMQFPAGYPAVLAVTAVDSANRKAPFANYGAEWVDLAAPGVGITSTVIGPQGSGYASWSGTSMATPFVSGAAALVYARFPGATAGEVASLLTATRVDLNRANPTLTGQVGGLLDIGGALQAGLQVGTAATLAPTGSSALTPGATAPDQIDQQHIYLPVINN
jgi:subtilisin family serine protease